MATLSEAKAILKKWEDASAAVAVGKEFAHNNRRLTREDGEEIREQINYWTNIVSEKEYALNHGRRRPRSSLAVFLPSGSPR